MHPTPIEDRRFSRAPLDPLEKNIFLTIKMLIGMQNITTMFMYPASNFGHYARLIWTVKQSNDRTFHNAKISPLWRNPEAI